MCHAANCLPIDTASPMYLLHPQLCSYLAAYIRFPLPGQPMWAALLAVRPLFLPISHMNHNLFCATFYQHPPSSLPLRPLLGPPPSDAFLNARSCRSLGVLWSVVRVAAWCDAPSQRRAASMPQAPPPCLPTRGTWGRCTVWQRHATATACESPLPSSYPCAFPVSSQSSALRLPRARGPALAHVASATNTKLKQQLP